MNGCGIYLNKQKTSIKENVKRCSGCSQHIYICRFTTICNVIYLCRFSTIEFEPFILSPPPSPPPSPPTENKAKSWGKLSGQYLWNRIQCCNQSNIQFRKQRQHKTSDVTERQTSQVTSQKSHRWPPCVNTPNAIKTADASRTYWKFYRSLG